MNRRQTHQHAIKSTLAARATRIGLVVIGSSLVAAGIVSLIRRVSAVAPAPATVLVTGLNGSANTPGNSSGSLNAPTSAKAKQAVSKDGRYVVFTSSSSNLAANDGNGTDDIFVRDLQTNTTTLVSITPGGVSGNSFSSSPVISGNGMVVAFSSQATNLVNDACNAGGMFVRNLQTNITKRVSLGCAVGAFTDPSLSFDGQYLAFQSNVNGLDGAVSGGGDLKVYRRDLVNDSIEMVSVSTVNTQADNGVSQNPSISDNGNFVAFNSTASNLTSATRTNTGFNTDVYVRDMTTKKTAMVSTISSNTAGANDVSDGQIISGDGKTIVFRSAATNLVSNDSNARIDIFARKIGSSTAAQLTLAPTSLVSINSAGTNGGNNNSFREFDVSTDGRYVAFDSSASDLVAIDTNAVSDVFRRDLQTNTTDLVSIRSDGSASSANGGSSPFISGDGTFVLFQSSGNDLASNDSNSQQDVFVRNLYAGTTILASVKSDNSTSGGNGTTGYSMGKSGNTVAFSGGPDIIPGVGAGNVFARTYLNPQVPATFTLTFDGKIRDRVGQGDHAIAADGQADGTFTVQLQPGGTTRQIVSLDLNRGDGNEWDTIPNTNWVLGAARSWDGALLNNAAGLVNFTIADGQSLSLFASDNGNLFVPGKTFTLVIGFSDGTSATANVTIPTPPVADLDVQVTDTPDPVVADSTLTYTISVMNKGSATAPNVLANTAIPTDTNFIPAGTSQGCVRIGTTRNVQCALGSIAPGDTVSKQITARPTGHSSPVTFDVSAASDLPDADPSNNSAKATTIVGPSTPPANDNFLNPIQLSGLSGTIAGTNVGATREIPIDFGLLHQEAYELNHADVNGEKSVWYYWTAPANSTGTMLVDTGGSDFDTLLAVYSVDTSTIELQKEISSNDDVLNTPISAVNFTFDSKHVYYFVVDGKQGGTGKIKLNWSAIVATKPATKVLQDISIGIYPSITCTTKSNALDICDKFIDPVTGYLILKIKGKNFTTESEALIKGVSVRAMKGFDRNGQPVFGKLSLINSTEIEARIPPDPPLNDIALKSLRVVTRLGPATNVAAPTVAQYSPDLQSVLSGLDDGGYGTAYHSRGLQTFEVEKVVIQPGKQQSICLGAIDRPGYETCLDITSKDTQPIQISPTYFAKAASCLKEKTDQLKAECLLGGAIDQYGFSINPSGPVDINVVVRKRVDLTPAVLKSIKTGGGKIGFVFEGGALVAGVVSNDSAGLVASGGGNIITQDGATLITNDGGTIITQDGATLITNDGGTLITNDGGTLITNDGGTLITNDGGTFNIKNGLVASGGGNLTSFSEFISKLDQTSAASVLQQTAGRPAAPSASASSGVGGRFLASSSGGQEPTFTTETDPVTGEVKGYITMTLDNTSFPRASDLKGLAFAVVVNPAVVQFAANNVTVDKAAGRATVTLTRTGDKSGSMTVDYATGNGTGNDRSDYTPVFGSVRFAPGETSKDVTIPLINHGYGTSDFGAQRTFNLIIVNVVGGAIQTPNFATVTITNTQPVTSPINPLDAADAGFYVRQQYLDFLAREPDQGGLDFWKASITACGSNQQCLDTKRLNASAAFFLSIEFQQTGYFVERFYKAAFGSASGTSTFGGSHQLPVPVVRLNEFLIDQQNVARGVVAGQTGWDTLLENNKQAFADEFVGRARFTNAFPATMTEAQFVNQLNTNVGNLLSGAELNQLITDLTNGTKTRAQVLRAVVDNQNVNNAEFNRAFVLMQYFGYLRRNPNEGQDPDYTGYDFWLTKLNSFNGNYTSAEMVKAFINSGEYRKRFGQ